MRAAGLLLLKIFHSFPWEVRFLDRIHSLWPHLVDKSLSFAGHLALTSMCIVFVMTKYSRKIFTMSQILLSLWPLSPGAVTQSVTPMYHLVTCLQYLRYIITISAISSSVTNLSSVRQPQSSSGLACPMNGGIFEIFSPCRSPAGCIAGRDNYIMSVWADSQLSFSTWIIHSHNISKRQLLGNIY